MIKDATWGAKQAYKYWRKQQELESITKVCVTKEKNNLSSKQNPAKNISKEVMKTLF